MATPLYVLTGFLGAGKTTLLNRLLGGFARGKRRALVLQFEGGEEPVASGVDRMDFRKKDLEKKPEAIAEAIAGAMKKQPFDAVWIEWNGVTPFATLQALLARAPLRDLLQLRKVVHVADAASVETLMGRTGAALPEQIANSDFAVVRGAKTPEDGKRMRRLLGTVNPGIPVYRDERLAEIQKAVFRRRENPFSTFFLLVVLMTLVYLAGSMLFTQMRVDINTIVNVFLGIILQAVPFLLIGVLLSSLIQTYISSALVERYFPKSLGLGMLAAVVGGFCLPVCDCASIPIFRTLVRKGVPLPAAIAFMTASPVINPVVIWSTYYAFGGDLSIVGARTGLGLISAVVIGLSFALRTPKEQVLSGGAWNRLTCSCGCYDDPGSVTGARAKFELFIRHAQAEFFDVGKYLILGTLVSSVFQAAGTGLFSRAQGGAGLVLSTVVMMVMAFVLSLCSSSDAVVGRSFASQFPMGAIMGFLVFGPMMDIKNAMMLSAGFSKKFIARLSAAAFAVCLTVVSVYCAWGGAWQ
jgi:uncharacterized membrane protein YraQ (UPF0718 family)